MSEAPLLLHAFSTFSLGGAQSRFITLANALGSAYRHLIVAMDGNFQAAGQLQSQVSWQPVDVAVQRGRGVANRAAFRQILVQYRPAIAFSYNWGAVEWMVANCPRLVPHVHVEDGFGSDEAQGQLQRRLWFRRFIFAVSSARLVVPSRTLQTASQKWWVPAARVVYVPNGVAVPDLCPPPHNRPGPILIGTVAGLRPEKNIARLIKAFAALRREVDARLLIAGDGGEMQNLRSLASRLGVEADVEMLGFMREPLELLRRLDLFALSSDTEQQPLALLESMAVGVPIVSTDVGDVAAMVPSGTARLARADDDDFTAALIEAVQRRSEWPTWAALGHAWVAERYSASQMIQSWARVFNGGLPCAAD